MEKKIEMRVSGIDISAEAHECVDTNCERNNYTSLKIEFMEQQELLLDAFSELSKMKIPEGNLLKITFEIIDQFE